MTPDNWNRRAAPAERGGDADLATATIALLDEIARSYSRHRMWYSDNNGKTGEITRAIEAALLAQREARPSLGAAADAVMAERERCAKVVPTTWLDPMFHTDDTPPLDGLSVEWVCKRIAAAIRASVDVGSVERS